MRPELDSEPQYPQGRVSCIPDHQYGSRSAEATLGSLHLDDACHGELIIVRVPVGK